MSVPGQSYEIRMLDNRKMGELPEITGKMVKVGIILAFTDLVWCVLGICGIFLMACLLYASAIASCQSSTYTFDLF